MLADARLAELIAAAEAGGAPEPVARRGPTVSDLASLWQEANRPHCDRRSGDWMGWSPKTAKTVEDSFRSYLLDTVGRRRANDITGLELDRLYARLLVERGFVAVGRDVLPRSTRALLWPRQVPVLR
jgi:hypothetical protein